MPRKLSAEGQLLTDARTLDQFLRRQTRLLSLREIMEETGLPQTRVSEALLHMSDTGSAICEGSRWQSPWAKIEPS